MAREGGHCTPQSAQVEDSGLATWLPEPQVPHLYNGSGDPSPLKRLFSRSSVPFGQDRGFWASTASTLAEGPQADSTSSVTFS